MLLPVLITLTVVITLIAIYFITTRKFDYWKKRGVPHLKPSFILGNYGDFFLLKKNLGHTAHEICKQFPDAPYVGAFYGTEPTLIVKDPEIVKIVTTKDFYFFSNKELTEHKHKEVVTRNLFNEGGDYWKVLRQNLTPLFSSAKMKKMFPLIENCTRVFEKLLDEETQKANVHETRLFMSRYTMDCIGSCVFGIDTKVLIGEADKNPFKIIANKIFDISTHKTMKLIMRSAWPSIFYGLGFKAFPVDVNHFFNKLLINVFEDRKNKTPTRHDFIDLMLSLKDKNCVVGDALKNIKLSDDNLKEKINLEINDELLVAQSIVFFAAGFETSATTASFTLYELAKDQELQKRAIAEVDEYLRRHEGKLNYECVTELPFLEACIDEALRLYPVLGVITREVVQDYTLSTGVHLEKGIRVHIPIYSIQRNPDFFPEPEQFRPERFLPENKSNVKLYSYMPFGEGPRICIGMRFAKMQMLAGLVTVLKKFQVELAEGMPTSIEYEPKSIVTQSKTGINLKYIPRCTNTLQVN